jgi:integral membrane protein (TIGR00529 family)
MLGLLKIFVAFASISFLVQKKVHLGTAMILGSILLALLSSGGSYLFSSGEAISPVEFIRIVWKEISLPSTLKLIGVVTLVLILSHCLERTGQMEGILRSFQRVVGDTRVVLMTLPALIGLLPMPGGAVFSAPMVEQAQKGINLPPTQKTLINYWFRHLWEYSWPLYPGLLLAAEEARKWGLNLSVFNLAAIQFPLTAAALAGGIIFILRKVPRPTGVVADKRRGLHLGRLAVDLLPITVIPTILILLYTTMGMQSKDKESLLAALCVAILLTLVISRVERGMPPIAVVKSISVARILSLVYMIVGMMVFRGTIQQSGSVAEISVMMKAHNVPLFPFVVFLSFISGLVTGLAMAYVGIVFPILTPLILQVTPAPLPYLVLAFGSGFLGVLFSPVHVCLILTHQYFRSDFSSVYRRMLAPALVILATLVALFFSLSLWPLSR